MLRMLALKAKGLKSRVFNITMGRVYTPEDVVAALRQVIPGAKVKIEVPEGTGTSVFDAERPTDISRAITELGYNPKYDLVGAIRDYVEWHKAIFNS